jgi:alpha-galactosidase
MPLHAVVETNAQFSRDSVRPLSAGALPTGIAPLVNQHSANQELIIEAALTENTDLAFQAFFNDPSNHLPLDDSWDLFNKMLRVGATRHDHSENLAPAWRVAPTS